MAKLLPEEKYGLSESTWNALLVLDNDMTIGRRQFITAKQAIDGDFTELGGVCIEPAEFEKAYDAFERNIETYRKSVADLKSLVDAASQGNTVRPPVKELDIAKHTLKVEVFMMKKFLRYVNVASKRDMNDRFERAFAEQLRLLVEARKAQVEAVKRSASNDV